MNITKRTATIAVNPESLKLGRLVAERDLADDANLRFYDLLAERAAEYTRAELGTLLGVSPSAVTQMLQRRELIRKAREARAARQAEAGYAA